MIKKIFSISLFVFFSITIPTLFATAEDFLDEKNGGYEKTTHVDGIEVLEEGLQMLKLASSARDRFGAHQGPFDSVVTEEDKEALNVVLKQNAFRVLGLYDHSVAYKAARKKVAFLKQSYQNKLVSDFIMAAAMMCYSYDGFLRQAMVSAGAYNPKTNSFARINMDEIKKTYIHPFQRLTNGIFEILIAGGRISSSAPYGTLEGDSKDAPSLFYYKNERGYITNIFSRLKGTLLLNDTFGDLVDGRYQHLFVFEDGKHNSECGLAVSFSENPTPHHRYQVGILPVRGGCSDLPYTACPVQVKRFYNDLDTLKEDPFSANLMHIFGEETFKRKKTKFFAVPSTPRDVAISELLFLESLVEAAKSEEPTVHVPALQAIQLIEEAAEASLTDIMQALEGEIKSDVEQTEANTVRIKEKSPSTSSSSQKHSKGTQKKGTKKGKGRGRRQQMTQKTTVAQSSVPSIEEVAQVRQDRINAIFETVKLEGRAKFGDYLKMINNIKRLFPKDVVAKALGSVSKKGSHSNFHALTGKGLTLVRKHGGDSHVPTGKVNSFGLQLIEVLVNQIAESATQYK
ncbi:MAG: hypothetical protein K2X53_01195 [Alphaproteobacteria bacterium]|nr:hypothetical protein [Alphaproteobacteria bacterium]